MKIRLLTNAALDELKQAALSNPGIYSDPSFDIKQYSTFEYPEYSVEEDNYPELELRDDNEQLSEIDFRNSLRIYRFFNGPGNQTPVSLMYDERYMAYLTHSVYFEYTKQRWPIDGEKQSGRIASRYFFDRAPTARHAILSLFWPAYLIAQAVSTDSKEVFEARLHTYFSHRTMVDRILERNYSRNPNLFVGILDFVASYSHTDVLMKKSGLLPKIICNMLSVISLDSMSGTDITAIVKESAEQIAQGYYDAKNANDTEDDAIGDDVDTEAVSNSEEDLDEASEKTEDWLQ